MLMQILKGRLRYTFIHDIYKIIKNLYIYCVKNTISIAYLFYKFGQHKHTHYIIICDHIGDTLIALGYIPAFCKKYNIKKYKIVLTEYQKELINFYSYANSHIDTIDRRVLHYLLPITSSNWGQYVLERMNNIMIINPANAFIGGFNYISRYPNISLKACIQYGD
ncbi:MAG: hypothetical protein LUH04_10375, partial [Clostridium sp.]|nr:hypothetical protein [Clostridium sp.]